MKITFCFKSIESLDYNWNCVALEKVVVYTTRILVKNIRRRNKYNIISGDSFSHQHGASFTTFDKDQDTWEKNCAVNGAWWHKRCHLSNLNGLYLKGKNTQAAKGNVWKTFKGYNYALKISEMKFKPVYDY